MGAKISAIVCVAMAYCGQATAHDWFNNQHACVVENADFIEVGDTNLGIWKNAPRSFFLSFQSCSNFAKAEGLEYEVTDLTKASKFFEQAQVNRCIKDGFPENNLLEVDGLGFLHGQPLDESMLLNPVASPLGMMVFGDDGFVDFAQFGQVDAGGATAWWMLRANCTVIKR